MIGIAVVSHNRESQIKQVLESLKGSADHLVIVNDGTPYNPEVYPEYFHLIQHEKPLSVGIAKNSGMKYLMEKGCDYIFTWEDDHILKDKNLIQKYIELSKISGIKTLNFAYHGPANKLNGKPNPKFTVEYENDLRLSINEHVVGAITLYHRSIIEKCGYHDEKLNHNSWEHCELVYRFIKAGFHPPFWNFADLADSYKYVEEIGTVDTTSVIRKSPEWTTNMKNDRAYLVSKMGMDVLQLPKVSKEYVYKWLEKRQGEVLKEDLQVVVKKEAKVNIMSNERKFIILYPTIRIQKAIEVHKDWMLKAKNPKRVRTVWACNTEEQKKEILEYGDFEVIVSGNHIKGVPYSLWRITSTLEANPQDIIISSADDFYFPENWDEIILNQYKDNFDGCVVFKDGISDKTNAGIVTLPIMTFNCLLKLNRTIYSCNYKHLWADNELFLNLTEMNLLKDVRKDTDIMFEHRHWVKGVRPKDDTDIYAEVWSGVDCDVWKQRSKMNLQDRLYSNNLPSAGKLSILIPSLTARAKYLQRLTDNIQIQSFNKTQVEVLTEIDDGKKTIGQKRNELLLRAQGEYICFVDDDDLLPNDSIPLQLQAINMGYPDVIGMHLLMITNGIKESECRTYHSLQYNTWYDEPDPQRPGKRRYFRNPNHLNPVKRLYAVATMFPEINMGEDRIYSANIHKYLKREIMINKPTYYYMVRTNKEC